MVRYYSRLPLLFQYLTMMSSHGVLNPLGEVRHLSVDPGFARPTTALTPAGDSDQHWASLTSLTAKRTDQGATTVA